MRLFISFLHSNNLECNYSRALPLGILVQCSVAHETRAYSPGSECDPVPTIGRIPIDGPSWGFYARNIPGRLTILLSNSLINGQYRRQYFFRQKLCFVFQLLIAEFALFTHGLIMCTLEEGMWKPEGGVVFYGGYSFKNKKNRPTSILCVIIRVYRLIFPPV